MTYSFSGVTTQSALWCLRCLTCAVLDQKVLLLLLLLLFAFIIYSFIYLVLFIILPANE